MKVPSLSLSPQMSLILPVALLLSLGLNLWQAKDRWIQEATAPLEQQIQQLESTQAANNTVADLKTKDDAAGAKARGAVERRSEMRQQRYDVGMAKLTPVPCAPGADLVDTWNAIGQGASE